MSKRTLLRLLLLVLVLFATRKSMDLVFGYVLERVFADGTGCEVSLFNPKLSLFPLRGTIENAVIRHRSEPPDAGFRARKISIRLHFKNLFSKELLLSDLELEGASAHSDGTDTGFIQTFAFLFPPDDPSALPPEDTALRRWLKQWIFHVSTIRIRSDDRTDSLVIRYRGQSYRWDRVNVEFDEQGWDAKKPYDLKAVGSNFRMQGESAPEIPLGELRGNGEIGLGRLLIRDAKLTPGADSGAITGKGLILLKAPGKYDLAIDADMRLEYLRNVLRDLVTEERNIPAHLVLASKVSGEYLTPVVSGELQLTFGPGAIFPGRPECGLTEASGKFVLDSKGLVVHDAAVEDLVRLPRIALSFVPELRLDGDAQISLRREQRWIQHCFSTADSPGITESIADSVTNIRIEGGLEPRNLLFTAESETAVRNQKVQTKLSSVAHWRADTIDFQINEHGIVPQIQLESVEPSSEKEQTTFRRMQHSKGTIDASLSTATGAVTLRKLELRRYPTDRVFARITPFLGVESYEVLSKMPRDGSTIDLDAEGSVDPSGTSTAIKGKLTATNLDLLGIPAEKLSVPFSISKSGISLPAAVLETLDGTLRARVRADSASGELRADLQADRLELAALPIWRETSPDWRTLINGELEVFGTMRQPEYYGNVRLDTARAGAANTIRRSTLEIAGNRTAARIRGSLLDKSGDIDFSFPFDPSSGEEMLFVLNARDFPIDYFLLGGDPGESILTGTFSYRGPRNAPLLGNGTLGIDRLKIVRGDITFEESGKLEAAVRGGRLLFTAVKLHAGDRGLALTGFVDHQNGWQAAVTGKWDIGTFIPLGDALEQVSGDAVLDLRINGPWREPSISGPLRLEKASITFPLGLTVVGITEFNADGEFTGDDLIIGEISGRVGGSALKGTASVTKVFDPQARSVEANLEFSHVVLEPIENLTVDLDGHLQLAADSASPPLLSGEVLLRSGQYEDIIKLTQVLKSITNAISGAGSGSAGRSVTNDADMTALELDVALSAPSGFLIETNVVEAELRAELHLSGTIERPLLEGKIDAVEGTFGLQANEFELVSGTIVFSEKDESLDPRVSILGESTAISRTGEEHHVRLAIGGTLTQPEVNFSSDSGLRQEEIISMVGFGASIQPFEIVKGREKTRSFAELFNPTTGVSLRDRLAGLTEFSSVQIDSGLSPTTGEFVPRLIAKRPLMKGVDLELQSELAGNQASSFDLNYPLTPYLSLIGGYRTRPVTTNTNTGTGSVSVGLHYRTTFPGFHLISPELTRKSEVVK